MNPNSKLVDEFAFLLCESILLLVQINESFGVIFPKYFSALIHQYFREDENAITQLRVVEIPHIAEGYIAFDILQCIRPNAM